jgi:hypothetical protein
VSPAGSLKDREEAAASTAGNAEDGVNLGQQAYDEKFNRIAKASEDEDFDDIINRNFGDGATGTKVDAHGDTIQRNYNADPEEERQALQDQEQNPDSFFRPSTAGNPANKGNLAARLLAGSKRFGPSGGLIGIIVGGFGLTSVVMAPGSLLVAIEKAVTNDSSDSTRTNIVFRRAYMSNLFKKGSNDKLKSEGKFAEKTDVMSPDQKARFEKAGFTDVQLDSDGKLISMKSPGGELLDSGPKFLDYSENTVEGRKAAGDVFDVRSAFFQNQKFQDVLDKFSLKKSKRISPSDEEDPVKRKAAIDKSFDDNTGLKEEADPAARAKSLNDKTIGDNASKIKDKIGAVTDKAGKAGLAALPISAACSFYNVAKITTATIKAQWIYELISFAYPFVRAAAQIEDQGDIEPSVVENLADRLTWFDSNEKLPNGQLNPQFNKTAMDSQGLQMAIYGDFTGLSKFTQQYTSWGWEVGVNSVASSFVKGIQQFVGGKGNVKTICSGAKLAQEVAMLQCLNPIGVALCAGAAAFMPLVEKALVALAVEQLAQPAMKFLSQVDLSSALRGEGAGDAIAAGIGLLLSNQSLGSGLRPAGGSDKLNLIKKFISSTNDSYYAYVTQPEIDDAKAHPFDVTNQYSFTGRLASMINPNLFGDGTIFSKAANLTSVVGSSFATLSNPSANALFSQPSNMTYTDALGGDAAANRIGKCQDPDMQEIDAACDWSGRIVGYTSDNVINGANQIANGGGGSNDIIAKSLDYLKQNKDINPDTGDIIPKSDFDNWVNYCTDKRKDPVGTTTQPIADDDGNWFDGERCLGKDPADQEMLDSFATWHNWCYVQYATAERKDNCISDKPEAGNAANTSAAKGSIAEVATQMGAWGAQYQACYVYGGGHGKDTAWIQQAIANHFTGAYAVDCSAFVRAVILQATGNDIGDVTTQTLCSSQDFDHIPRAQAQPGDLAINCSEHVEVITANNGGTFATVGSHSDGCGPGLGASPGTYQGTESFVLRYKGAST